MSGDQIFLIIIVGIISLLVYCYIVRFFIEFKGFNFEFKKSKKKKKEEPLVFKKKTAFNFKELEDFVDLDPPKRS